MAHWEINWYKLGSAISDHTRKIEEDHNVARLLDQFMNEHHARMQKFHTMTITRVVEVDPVPQEPDNWEEFWKDE